MPNAQRKEWEDNKFSEQNLKRSLDKLREGQQAHDENKVGLSKFFQSHAIQVEKALEKCEKAMEVLANEYVDQMALLKETKDPEEVLGALNKSEEIWRKETATIRRYDHVVHENAFLDKMRLQAVVAFENKLIEVCEQIKYKPSMEKIALCLGLLGTLDTSLGDLGYPETCYERKRLCTIAKSFKG